LLKGLAMPLTNLNIGAAPNDGTGETLRSGGAKINTNYTFTVTTDTGQQITGAKTFTSPIGAADGAVGTPSVTFASDLNTGMWRPAADTVAFSTGGAERVRIDSSGRFLVGTSTARANFFNTTSTSDLQVEASNGIVSVVRNNNSDGGPAFIFGKTRGTTPGSTTIVQNGDLIGGVSYQGMDGTEFVVAAQIDAFVDGTPGANDMPGRLVFSTTADGASTPTERMRIASDGTVQLPSGSPGIKFGTRNANLADYEEGTFIPTVTSGSGSITSVTTDGRFTKIGNLVTVILSVTLVTVGTAGGELRTTLPVPAAASDRTVGSCRESELTGVWYGAHIRPDLQQIRVTTFSNTAIVWTNGHIYSIAITYRAS
jgi:hypothetical protein